MPVRGFRPPNKRYESAPLFKPDPIANAHDGSDPNNTNSICKNNDSPIASGAHCTKHRTRADLDKQMAPKISEAANVPKLAPRIPLFDAINQNQYDRKSCINNPGEPMYSSFSKNEAFNPASDEYKVIRTKLQQQAYAEMRSRTLFSAREHRSTAEDVRAFTTRYSVMLERRESQHLEDEKLLQELVKRNDGVLFTNSNRGVVEVGQQQQQQKQRQIEDVENNNNERQGENRPVSFSAVPPPKKSARRVSVSLKGTSKSPAMKNTIVNHDRHNNNFSISIPPPSSLVPKSSIIASASHLKEVNNNNNNNNNAARPSSAISKSSRNNYTNNQMNAVAERSTPIPTGTSITATGTSSRPQSARLILSSSARTAVPGRSQNSGKNPNKIISADEKVDVDKNEVVDDDDDEKIEADDDYLQHPQNNDNNLNNGNVLVETQLHNLMTKQRNSTNNDQSYSYNATSKKNRPISAPPARFALQMTSSNNNNNNNLSLTDNDDQNDEALIRRQKLLTMEAAMMTMAATTTSSTSSFDIEKNKKNNNILPNSSSMVNMMNVVKTDLENLRRLQQLDDERELIKLIESSRRKATTAAMKNLLLSMSTTNNNNNIIGQNPNASINTGGLPSGASTNLNNQQNSSVFLTAEQKRRKLLSQYQANQNKLLSGRSINDDDDNDDVLAASGSFRHSDKFATPEQAQLMLLNHSQQHQNNNNSNNNSNRRSPLLDGGAGSSAAPSHEQSGIVTLFIDGENNKNNNNKTKKKNNNNNTSNSESDNYDDNATDDDDDDDDNDDGSNFFVTQSPFSASTSKKNNNNKISLQHRGVPPTIGRYPSGHDIPTKSDLLFLISQANAEKEKLKQQQQQQGTSPLLMNTSARKSFGFGKSVATTYGNEENEEGEINKSAVRRRPNSARVYCHTNEGFLMANNNAMINNNQHQYHYPVPVVTKSQVAAAEEDIEKFEKRNATATVPFVRTGAVDGLQKWLHLCQNAGVGGQQVSPRNNTTYTPRPQHHHHHHQVRK